MNSFRALLNRDDLQSLGIKVSNTTLLRWEADGRFPRRVRLAHTSVAWLAAEIEEWLQSCAEARVHHHYAEIS